MIVDAVAEMDMEHLEHLPVLAVCGYSGAGKTTLIKRLIGILRRKGLSVAVIKHDVHGLTIDREGKDSDRFFKAGADVCMNSPDEGFIRLHPDALPTIEQQVRRLVRRYDLVLVEGHKQTPLPKLWLLNEGESAPPEGLRNLHAVLRRDQDRVSPAMAIIDRQLQNAIQNERLCGCVLIGGKSSRMGQPKHLIVNQNKTWLERTVAVLETVCQTVVISGSGRLPERLAGFPQLPDIPDPAGPLAGMLSAMRWCPDASWLVTACDMPTLSPAALTWLLSQRRPGVWAVLPQKTDDYVCQPLLAYYQSRCYHLLNEFGERDGVGPSAIIGHPKVADPTIPPALTGAWRNVNTPSELSAIRDETTIATEIETR